MGLTDQLLFLVLHKFFLLLPKIDKYLGVEKGIKVTSSTVYRVLKQTKLIEKIKMKKIDKKKTKRNQERLKSDFSYVSNPDRHKTFTTKRKSIL